MRRFRQRNILLYILPAILLICAGLWFLRNHYLRVTLNYQEISSENGVWDLSEYDFENGYVRLTGKGETIPGRLVPPQVFDDYSGEATYGGYETCPVNTTRLRILLPEDAVYMVAGPSAFFGDRLFIGGEPRQEAGVVSDSAETAAPGYAYFAAEARSENSELEIVRQTSNFVHRTNGDPVPLYIGSPEVIRRFISIETGYAGLILGVFFTLFILHSVLYLILQRYRANLYFALLCLGWCLRCGVTERALLADWFPGIPWEVLFRTEYLMVAAAAVCIFLVMQEIFPGMLPKGLKRVFFCYSGVYTLLCLFLPTYPLSYMNVICPAIYITLSIPILISLIRYLSAHIRNRSVSPEQWGMLAGILLVFFATAQDAFYYVNLIFIGVLNDFGFMVFAFFQTAVIFYGTMRELKEARQAEQDSRIEAEIQKKTGEAKEVFLHNLSHELQMPITVMSGFAQLTAQMLEDEPIHRTLIRENMRRVEDEAGRMERMVSMLLDVAALENGSFTLHSKPVDLNALIRAVVEVHFPVMDHNNNQIEVKTGEHLTVYGDPERLQQVLINLLSNAVKNTKNGIITIQTARKQDVAQVMVSDTGCGIPPELLPEMFRRFSRHSNEAGNGLGLYICKQLTEAHGGIITIQSELYRGTQVCFTVPLWKEDNQNG